MSNDDRLKIIIVLFNNTYYDNNFLYNNYNWKTRLSTTLSKSSKNCRINDVLKALKNADKT